MQSGFVTIRSLLPMLKLRVGDPNIEDMLPDLNDMVRLVEEAIGLSFDNTPIREIDLTIVDYKAKLPAGFYKIADIDNNINRNKDGEIPANRTAPDVTSAYYRRNSFDKALWKDYSIEGCWLKSPFRGESVHVTYYSLPVDSEGINMIKEGHEMAFMAFVKMIRMETRYSMREAQYYEVERSNMEYEKQCGYARAKDGNPSRKRLASAADINNDPYKMIKYNRTTFFRR